MPDSDVKQQQRNRRLLQAAIDGDLEKMTRALGGGADINTTGRECDMATLERAHDWTPLMQCLHRRHENAAHCLINRGADVNKGDAALRPLHLAIRDKAYNTVPALLAAGADPSARMVQDFTPLFLALEHGVAQVVQQLLAAGADPDGPGPHGNRPLILAARDGHAAMTQMLLNAHADVNLANGKQTTPLMEAVVGGHDEVAGMLIRAGADANARDWRGQTVLFQAVSGRSLECVRLVLQAGANPDAGCTSNYTPLHSAVSGIGMNGDDMRPIIRELLAHGANPDVVFDNNMGTALLAALNLERLQKTRDYAIEVATLLLDAGADPDTSNKYGTTALGQAQEYGYDALVDRMEKQMIRNGIKRGLNSPVGSTKPLTLRRHPPRNSP